MLTSSSDLLLAHYVAETGASLSTLPERRNPFLVYLVPLSCSDDLLMHSLLAVSGAHLAFRTTSMEIHKAMCQHYAAAIKALQVAIRDIAAQDVSKTLGLLLAMMNLAFFEVSRLSRALLVL